MGIFGRLSSRKSKAISRLAEEIEILRKSPLLDPVWYRQTYPDLRDAPIDVARHYLEYGASEGRNPSPLFDTKAYLQQNPDVAASGANPLVHFLRHSAKEAQSVHFVGEESGLPAPSSALGRSGTIDPSLDFDADWYLRENPDVAGGVFEPCEHYLRVGKAQMRHPRFDADFYMAEYPDVAAAGVDPYQHYLQNGKSEGRHPAFNRVWYLAEYPDVAAAGVDPYQHYLQNGRSEGREPAFNRDWYLRENPDVAAAGVDPYEHYATVGKTEGRAAYSWGRRRSSHRARSEAFPISYDSEYQANEEFGHCSTDIKAIAFYLPQFHECEQNNRWWGHGFTEWNNTRRSRPRFIEHYQPREPHDHIGYYDLSDVSTLRRQARLAREHGIYGFCFYHYWFSGTRVLEKPVDLLIATPDIEIPFCLCWANENWTRTWDGLDADILLKQNYSEDDPPRFIQDIAPYLIDPRYIRIDNKPVIMVYKAHLIPNVGAVFDSWRHHWREMTGGELIIWCNRTNHEDTSVRKLGPAIDAVVEFPPHVVPYEIDQRHLGIEATGRFYDYQHLVADIIAGTERTENPSSAFYRSVMLGWDNSARRSEGWSVWYGFSLDAYYEWLRTVIAYTRNAFPTDQRFVFINAWNEWAEGTYLEPDKRCGYANINTTSRALFDLPREPLPQVLAHSEGRGECNPGTIAVHAHIYFEDVADELLRYINNIPYPFDLYITTDTSGKRDLIRQKFEKDGRQASLAVIQTANVGRDIAPLLVALGRKLANYDYIGHFHTKKSTTVDWGDRWRRYLLDNLLGSSSSVRAVFQEFGRARQVGLIYPPTYPLVAPHADWGGMKERCRALLSEIGADIWLPERPRFPAGNMFWARTAAIRSILGRTWHYDQFEAEEGQVENTTAHCVERLWRYIASSAGYETREALLRDRALKVAMAASYRRLTIFSHYDKRNVISDSDIFYVKSLKDAESDVVFVSNCELSSEQRASVTPYVESLLQRSNVGFDFSAWRDCIDTIGWTRLRAYDELVLANNSCYGPIFPLREMFAAMTDRCCDFWAITGFPSLRNSPRAEASLLPGRNIPLHLQSYFMAFRKSVLRSDAFARFWSQVEDQVDLIAVVAQYESQLTRILSEAGFRWDCYLPETFVMQERNTRDPEFNATYCQPAETILMRAPFVKKKAAMYAPDQIDKATKLIRRFGYYPGSLALWGCG